MNQMRKITIISFILMALLILTAGSASAKDCGTGIAECECGDTVIADWTFTDDLVCPTGEHGLIIGVDGITIDGAGYKLSGSETAEICDWIGETNPGAGYCGIFNLYNDSIIIKNLEIENFCTGIGFQGSGANPVDGIIIDNCEIHDNGNATCSTDTSIHGIHICYITSSTISNNLIYNNTGTGAGCGDGGNGIFLYSGSKEFADNHITDNKIFNNRKGGFFTKKGLQNAVISGNHVYGNGQGGIVLRCRTSSYNTIKNNNASYNYGDGIFIGGENNTLTENIVKHNTAGLKLKSIDIVGDGDGIDMGRNYESNSNELIINEICGNEGTDIEVADGCSGNHGSDNICDTVKNYNDNDVTGCKHNCEGEVAASSALTTTSNTSSADSSASAPGLSALLTTCGLLISYIILKRNPKK